MEDMSEHLGRPDREDPHGRHSRGAPSGVDAHNRTVYESAEVVAEFVELEGLFPCERHVFDTYIAEATDVLDLGVGAGRTVPVLEARARRYTAVDYSAGMVEACKARFPTVDVRLLDAADLSTLESGSFDVVVFSYNGLDYLHPVEKRRTCIAEMARVIRPGGTVIISSHNARAVFRPGPIHGTSEHSRLRALAVQVYGSMRLAIRSLPSQALWRGRGYVRDSASANIMYAVSPRNAELEFAGHGFALAEVAGSRFPQALPRLLEPWYYYVFERRPQV